MTAPLALVVPHRHTPHQPASTGPLDRRTALRPGDARRPVRIYLSGVKSATHLVYAASYVRHLLASTQGPVTLVDLGVGAFMGRANVTAQDVHDLMPTHPRLTVVAPEDAERWRAEPGERLVYVGVGAPGIKPYLRLRTAHRLRPIHVVVIDEGIGSYGNWRTRRDACVRQGSSGPWSTVRSLAVTASRGALTCERWALYRDDEQGWNIDERVAAELRRPVTDVSSPPRTAVFLCQPWVDLGLMEERRYLDHLGDVAGACAAAGLRFRVRPHPTEDAARYRDFEVTSARGPGELDPQVAGAAVVLGTSSTALLNVASLYGTPAIRVAVPELAHLDDRLSPRQRSLLGAYLPAAVPVGFLTNRLSRVVHSTSRIGSGGNATTTTADSHCRGVRSSRG
jgi:hypothetical protein